MKRRLSFLLALAGLPLISSAQIDEAKTIQVYQGESSNPSYEYLLDDTRKIFFGADDFTFTFYSSNDASFKLEDVRCIKFGDGVPSSIESVINANEGIQLTYSDNALLVRGCKETSVLTVVDITGRTVLVTKVNGDAQISLAALASGIYLANISNKTIKFSI